jgi:phosphomevalonate kinase
MLSAHALWSTLDKLNQSLAQTLLQISRLASEHPAVYEKAVRYISSLQPVQVSVGSAVGTMLNLPQWLANPNHSNEQQAIISAFYETHKISQLVRGKMREMGEASGVPIEPPQQTQLLDACTSLAGIIGGGVPGGELPLSYIHLDVF